MPEPTTASRIIDEEARRGFEATWAGGRPQPIEHFLPPGDHVAHLGTLEELVLIELEFTWKGWLPPAGEDGATVRRPARVEDYLTRFPQLNRPGVVERLLREEYRLRQRAGDSPSLAAYRARFPAVDLSRQDVTVPQRASRPVGLPVPTVPGYEVLEELGRGGMGVVYKARQLKLHRLVALKMVLSGKHAGPVELVRFLAEAEAVARLQHPNIVQVYEIGQYADLPYMALEYVEGGSLDRKLRGTPLPVGPAAQLVETLARALQHAHERGIIHRDLKPANILLVSGGVVSGEW
jgi:hypothetical protein